MMARRLVSRVPGPKKEGSSKLSPSSIPLHQGVVLLISAIAGTFALTSWNFQQSHKDFIPPLPVAPDALDSLESVLTSAPAKATYQEVHRRLQALLDVATVASDPVPVPGAPANRISKPETSPVVRLLRLSRSTMAACHDSLRRAQAELAKPPPRVKRALNPENKDIRTMNLDSLALEIETLREKVARLNSELVTLKKDKGILERSTKNLGKSLNRTLAQGYSCTASEKQMKRYLNYEPRKSCPNDWYFVQRLIFKYNCFALPRRRCRVNTPTGPVEPLPLPASLFNQSALDDRNVRWDLHECKSYECLVNRSKGDCLDCFNMTREGYRWKNSYAGTIPIRDVIALKDGTLRLGLDAGGGTGSFAAHMAGYGVTVMTTAMNLETWGGYGGLPYHETIAARGLIPLHVPHGARLPLYDGVLDVIHSMNSIKYLALPEFEDLLYDWDRVLRVGGILWFDMFYAQKEEMPKYVSILEQLEYKKLYWNFTPKTGVSEKRGEHVYLNCVLEKQPAPGKDFKTKPEKEDTDWGVDGLKKWWHRGRTR